jgi:hypothetical protein
MAVFTISDKTIDVLKNKKLWMTISTAIISMVIWGSLSFFAMVIISMISIKIFIISICFSVVIISLTIYFSLRFSLKLFIKEMKSIQYIFENERLIIKKNNSEQYNISKNDIQCITKYKNSMIIILNSNRKIIVEKNLDNFDQLIENLNSLSKVNIIDKNHNNIIKMVGIVILQIIILFTLFMSKNIVFVVVSGLIAIVYCINNYFDKSIDIKRRKLLLGGVIIIVLLQIIRLLLLKLL